MWTWADTDITFDQTCWYFDGTNDCSQGIVERPRSTGGGNGRIRRRKKRSPPIIPREETIRINRENKLILEFIKVILTKGLI